MSNCAEQNGWSGFGAARGSEAGNSLNRAVRAGDKRAFLELVSGYQRMVLQLALNLTASEQAALEIHNEVFARAYASIPRLAEETSLFVWLGRLTVQSWLKRSAPGPVAPAAPAPENQAARVSWAMSSLTTRERLVFVLKHQQGFALATIAAIANMAEDEVRTALDRAVGKLRARSQP